MKEALTISVTIVDDLAQRVEVNHVTLRPTHEPDPLPLIVYSGGPYNPISFAGNPQAIHDIHRAIAAPQNVLKSS